MRICKYTKWFNILLVILRFLNVARCVIVFFPPVLHWCSLNMQWRASGCSTEQEKSVQVTLFANPGCREMRARGPSKYQSSWAPKAWIRRNETVAWRTARSPVTTGNAFLLPFSVTIPSNNERSTLYIYFLPEFEGVCPQAFKYLGF